ncbi:MAG TPA: hypothetical protein PK992_05255 [Planctomycetaceae bacterium]|nr:hypothetical protein [Planctomycetaceae bacterium]
MDRFLDRCRTTINVLGDVNVSCLLDGRVKTPAQAAVVRTSAECARVDNSSACRVGGSSRMERRAGSTKESN